MILGQVVKAYREKRKMSLRQLAKVLGLEHTKLHRFEQGHEAQSPVFAAVVMWLITATDEETSSK